MSVNKVKYKLRKGDSVVVIAGKDKKKDKVAKVTLIDKVNGKVVVEGVNVVKRHTKPNQLNPDGGIIEKSLPIDISNVMYFCKKCNKGVRLGIKVLENGKKSRCCRKCGEVIDSK